MAIPIVRPGQGGEPPRKRPTEAGGKQAPRGDSPRPSAPRRVSEQEQERPRRPRSPEQPEAPRSASGNGAPRRPARPQGAPEARGEQRREPRRTQKATPGSAPRQAPRKRVASSNGEVPLKNAQGNRAEDINSPRVRTDWVVDPKTGVKHRVLPKTEWDPDSPGFSISHLEDSYDASYDLDSMAKDFLGHLRVAPTKKELDQLRKEREARRELQEKEYQELHAEEEDEEYDYDEDDE